MYVTVHPSCAAHSIIFLTSSIQNLKRLLSRISIWDMTKPQVIWVPVPKQNGSTECGLLVCEMARQVTRNEVVTYATSNDYLSRLREVIAFEILQRRLLEDPEDILTAEVCHVPNCLLVDGDDVEVNHIEQYLPAVMRNSLEAVMVAPQEKKPVEHR